MGKKHKHEKHHKRDRHYSTDSYEDSAPVLIPKLIVKFGSDNTPEREESPAMSRLMQQDFQDSTHSHRHKEKKKKKKKDKKKHHEKDKEHRKKKKRKREYESDDEAPELYPSAPPQLTPQNPHNDDTPSPEPDLMIKRLCPDPRQDSLSPSPLPTRSSSSSSKVNTSLGKVLEYLLVMLEKKDVHNFFSNPVSDSLAPGYSSIIKEPMDFSTMREMIEESKFKTLSQFRSCFDLICNNCMTYNGPETVYFKAAKLLQRQGQRILAPERIKALAEHLPLIKDLTVEELGFELTEDITSELTVEDEKDVSKFIEEIRVSVSQPSGKFEAIPDTLLPEEILAQAQAAAKQAKDKLNKKGGAPMGYLRRKQDDSTSLAIITPGKQLNSCSGFLYLSFLDLDANGKSEAREKAVNLSQLIGKVKNGTSGLIGYKEDRRNAAKAIHPLYYGAYSSHGPTHDSTFANLTKPETELVYSTYGDEVGVAYAESIKNFSRNCDYASIIVDNLLDILTGSQHSKTTKYIEEQKSLRVEEMFVNDSLKEKVDFDGLKSLESDGIDMSFLSDLQKHYNDRLDVKLEQTASLLDQLRETQHDRLSAVSSNNIGELKQVGEQERTLAGNIQSNLVDMVTSGARPSDLGVNPASLAAVKRTMPVDL